MVTNDEIQIALRELVRGAKQGTKLPTVRDLMSTYRASQAVVQRALSELVSEGLIEAYVGRGTFVSDPGRGRLFPSEKANPRNVLLLTRNVGSARTRRLLARLQERLSQYNIDALQVTYVQVEQVIQILRGIPAVDVTIVQCHFDMVSIELLHALQKKSKSTIFDGATISGLNVDSIASDWRSSLEVAVNHLIDLGHRSIGIVGAAGDARPMEAIRMHYESLRKWRPGGVDFFAPVWLHDLPTEEELDGLEEALRNLCTNGKLPFSSLIVWGALDGEKLHRVFQRLGISVPSDLSVSVLGHRGVSTESNGFFTMTGSSVEETLDALVAATTYRFQHPTRAPIHKYLSPGIQLGASTSKYNMTFDNTI